MNIGATFLPTLLSQMGRTKTKNTTKETQNTTKAAKNTTKAAKKKEIKLDTSLKRHSQLCQEIRNNVKKHGKSEKTNHLYEGHVKWGRQWVKEYVRMQTELEDAWNASTTGVRIEDDDSEANAELDPEFATCLDSIPLECTPTAIAMFMHHKCFIEGRGKSTVDQVHAAFLLHYDLM